MDGRHEEEANHGSAAEREEEEEELTVLAGHGEREEEGGGGGAPWGVTLPQGPHTRAEVATSLRGEWAILMVLALVLGTFFGIYPAKVRGRTCCNVLGWWNTIEDSQMTPGLLLYRIR
jgi:hypothetical protein